METPRNIRRKTPARINTPFEVRNADTFYSPEDSGFGRSPAYRSPWVNNADEVRSTSSSRTHEMGFKSSDDQDMDLPVSTKNSQTGFWIFWLGLLLICSSLSVAAWMYFPEDGVIRQPQQYTTLGLLTVTILIVLTYVSRPKRRPVRTSCARKSGQNLDLSRPNDDHLNAVSNGMWPSNLSCPNVERDIPSGNVRHNRCIAHRLAHDPHTLPKYADSQFQGHTSWHGNQGTVRPGNVNGCAGNVPEHTPLSDYSFPVQGQPRDFEETENGPELSTSSLDRNDAVNNSQNVCDTWNRGNAVYRAQEYPARRTFSGANGDVWSEFIQYFENIMELNSWNQEKSRRVLLSTLRGQAETYAYGLPLIIQRNYERLKQKMDERFGHAAMKEQYIAEARLRRRQPNESLRDFGQAIEDLFRRAYPGKPDIVEENAIKSFLDKCGLSEEFRLAVKRTRPKTLQEAVINAMQEECLRIGEKDLIKGKYTPQQVFGIEGEVEVPAKNYKSQGRNTETGAPNSGVPNAEYRPRNASVGHRGRYEYRKRDGDTTNFRTNQWRPSGGR